MVCWLTCESPSSARGYGFGNRSSLPRGLDRKETAALLGSLRTERDRAIAGLMLLSGLRSAEVLGLGVRDVDIGRGWVRVIGKGDKERRVPLDPDVAGLIQTYLFAERPESDCDTLFLVAKGPNRGKPLTPAGLRTDLSTPPSQGRGSGWSSTRAAAHLRHRAGRGGRGPGGAAGIDGPRPRRLLSRLHSSVPGARARRLRCRPRPPARPVAARAARLLPRGPELFESYCAALAARGAGNRSFLGAARVFLDRWPDPQAWAEQPLPVRLSAGSALRPLLTYLMLAGFLRPGYDYLLKRKLPAILREAHTSPLATDMTRFLSAATELGYSTQIAAGLASQVAVRMLIQTGRPFGELDDADIAEFAAAITAREQARGRQRPHYRTALYATRGVLYHLDGRVSPTAKNTRAPALAVAASLRQCAQNNSLIRWWPTWNAPREPVRGRPCSASPAVSGTSPSFSPTTTPR